MSKEKICVFCGRAVETVDGSNPDGAVECDRPCREFLLAVRDASVQLAAVVVPVSDGRGHSEFWTPYGAVSRARELMETVQRLANGDFD